MAKLRTGVSRLTAAAAVKRARRTVKRARRRVKLGSADLKAGRNMQTKKKTPAMAKQCLGRFLMPAHHGNASLLLTL